jgi:hypothetical protein
VKTNPSSQGDGGRERRVDAPEPSEVDVIDLDTPTKLAFEWGWLLATRANLLVFLLIPLVFVLGVTVRLPGAKADIEQAAARLGEERADR